MSKCLGCGIELQNNREDEAGYITDIDKKLCNRCFNIQNYNSSAKSNVTFDNDWLLSKINDLNIFTFFLCDFVSLNKENIELYKKIKNPKIFVLTKVDILPKNVYFNKLKINLNLAYGINDVIFFSKENGYGANEILKICEKEKNTVFVGPTSSGKSSMLNYLFSKSLTVSNYQNTTQDFITIEHESLNIIDAPGFLSLKESYKLKGKIVPKTLLLKKEYMLVIHNNIFAFDKDTYLTLMIIPNINIQTKKKTMTLEFFENALSKSDIVIDKIGFIYIPGNDVNVYSNTKLNIRPSLIKGEDYE